MEDARLLVELVNTRIAIVQAYDDNIRKIDGFPSDIVDKLTQERDEVLAELNQRIDALRQKIAN